MPFNQEQLAYAGRHSQNYYLNKNPIDQVNVERPLIKFLMEDKQEYVGGLQFVTEKLRYQNDSNFQAFFGDSQVTYNRKRTLTDANFTYGAFHDGYGLNDDELIQNGITMTDDRTARPTDAEKVQLVNLLDENNETLRLGFQEGMDLMLHRDGSQSPLEIPGLSSIIALDPTTNTNIGGINQQQNPWWRNYAATDIAETDLIGEMEAAWMETTRYGGNAPNKILAGTRMIAVYREQAGETVNRQITQGGKGGVSLDASVSGLYFHGVPIEWDPVFDILDALDNPAIPWSDRMYFINRKYLRLRPIKGHWMVPRKPPRVYDRYVHYWALTARAALTTGKRNAHAVLALEEEA